ncbi:hypothetical protein [Nonomuraea rhodomycinica]|uniref:Uncharacterized protein n=1 Tax=Nonomuraea rhodomycinica TaxID=1712872 RepID=A0A7Y6IWK8_9ACTN|nr:hypothetical protein [Nonomuraea rhodomycinica]NUW45510.1 hypothetical protein [Nonomuraea rhodomycinica]
MSTTTATPAEQAMALLAYAADGRHFYEGYIHDNHRTLHERDAATAMYAAQAATAHTLLAITSELAELREAVRQVAACRTELAEIATAVRYLAGAHDRSNARLEDALSGITASIEKTASDSLDNIADAIRESSQTLDANLLGVQDALTPQPRWWQFGLRRSQRDRPESEGSA